MKKLPSIFFVLSKAKIDDYVKHITGNFLDHTEVAQVKQIWKQFLFKYREEYKFSTQFDQLYNLVCRGIGYHHSGIIPILKEIVEILYSKKLIKVLLATETFAVGVNMPTKTVVFTGLSKYSNSGRRLLRTDEFLQMAGRAGRRGIDTFGEVIILPNYLPSEKEFKDILLGKPLILESRLKLDYTWVLRNLYNLNLKYDINKINVTDELVKIAKDSFLERNNLKELSFCKDEYLQLESEYKILRSLVSEDYYLTMIKIQKDMHLKLSQKKKRLL